MTNFIKGDRVRCNRGGRGFPGLHGTLVDIIESDHLGQYGARVEWDNPPAPHERDCASETGGDWGVTSLDLLARLKDGTEVGYGDHLTFEEGRTPSVYFDGAHIPADLVVTIDRVYHDADSANILIDLKAEDFAALAISLEQDEYGWPLQGWNPEWFTAVKAEEPEPEEFGRPTVSFSDANAGRDRSKAREAAQRAMSKVLKDTSNNVFRAAMAGADVDAYALNAAVLDAMRSAATRSSSSVERRDLGTALAHLGHIVQAVIENHADNLPGYEPGARSRAIKEAEEQREHMAAEARSLRTEIDHSVEVNQRLTEDLTKAREERSLLTQAASDERRRLVAEIEHAQKRAESFEASSTEAWAEVARMTKVLDYTRAECVDNEAARQKSYGFEDGIKA